MAEQWSSETHHTRKTTAVLQGTCQHYSFRVSCQPFKHIPFSSKLRDIPEMKPLAGASAHHDAVQQALCTALSE